MIVPPVGGLGGGLSIGQTEGLTQGSAAGPAEGLAQGGQAGGAEPVAGESGSFESALTGAISSLDKTQQSADSASQALAAGTVKDPESAVVTVEDAQMAMELAAQIRTKATEAVQSIFQTQA
jgi:flagellar hook-basal body complex protein FliE